MRSRRIPANAQAMPPSQQNSAWAVATNRNLSMAIARTTCAKRKKMKPVVGTRSVFQTDADGARCGRTSADGRASVPPAVRAMLWPTTDDRGRTTEDGRYMTDDRSGTADGG